MDFADVKPSVMSVLVILAIVVIGIPMLKVVANRWSVPGFTNLVNAV